MRTTLLLALAATIGAACSATPPYMAERPESAFPYRDETLARFRRLVESGDWCDPGWNARGTLEVTVQGGGGINCGQSAA